jgi:hypothetical protein
MLGEWRNKNSVKKAQRWAGQEGSDFGENTLIRYQQIICQLFFLIKTMG